MLKARTVKFNFWCLWEERPEKGATAGVLLSKRVFGVLAVGGSGLKVQGRRAVRWVGGCRRESAHRFYKPFSQKPCRKKSET